MAESIIQHEPLTDVSSQVSVLRSGVTAVRMFVQGHTAHMSFKVTRQTPDQAQLLSIPAKYKPKTAVTFAPFYMNGEDMQRGCCAYIYEGNNTIQFRTYTNTTGTGGVDFSGSWPF